MGDPLDRYRDMRRFDATPEPAGAPPRPDEADRPRFVIQQHSATALHWDLRLERDGVLVSFACPRCLPWRPRDNRLAIHTEDHPLEYLEFHGEIPTGNYGAGTMTIWDRGSYETHEFTDSKVTVTLHGDRVVGTYALFPLARRGGSTRDWMIHRVDPPQDPHRRPLPDDLRPMRATRGGLPTDDGWAFEIRWTGLRVLVTNEPGHLRVHDADGTDVTGLLPEVRPLGRALGAVEVVLDAVVVAVDRDGRPAPSDDRLDRRRRVSGSNSRVRRLAEERPVAAMVVDLLWLEGYPAYPASYDDRRRLLDGLDLAGPAWQVPRAHLGDGAPLLAAARAQGLSGLVAKLRTSPYVPGGRSESWRDVRVGDD